jgi:hypothetical protein
VDEMTIVRDMGRVDALIGEEAACGMRLPGDDIIYGTPYMRWNGCRWRKETTGPGKDESSSGLIWCESDPKWDPAASLAKAFVSVG